MRNYYQVTEALLIALGETTAFSDDLVTEFISYGEYAKRNIVENVKKGGSMEDYISAAAFVSFMCVVNQHLHQIGQEDYLWLIRKGTDACWEYGRKFHELLIGEKES